MLNDSGHACGGVWYGGTLVGVTTFVEKFRGLMSPEDGT